MALATLSVFQGVYNDDEEVIALTISSGMKELDWVLNSGCSNHMCVVRKLFSTYHKVDKNTIRMANNTVNKVIGMRTIWFRRHDGKNLTLNGVQHVLGLRKNQISLGMLDSKGLGFSSSN